MRLYIKNMVSLRCKLMVKQELKKLGLHYLVVTLGMVELRGKVSKEQYQKLEENLLVLGLEVLSSKKNILIESIINVVIEILSSSDSIPHENYSDFISKRLTYDYTYLSKLFMEEKGITLQQFIITGKIEKVKECLLYEQLNIAEIAHKLHYSSAGHLSNQFKKLTGFTPSQFKQLQRKRQGNLQNL
ncbi:MAG TPA: AraC family transcriptional regulator [Cyclobacteriaceae bacterium]|nr:AraC family transcriptional regulator [Cyclobacteriaceae bacterium]